MKDRVLKFVYVALMLAIASTPAFAQGSSASSLSGVVVDADGGAIPGAAVVVKNNATGVSIEAVSNATGRFSFASLDPGTYTLTVALTGFKTFVSSSVRLLAATPGEVTAKLEIGALTETVEVKAASELVQTQSSKVSSTLTTEQLRELPLVSRNALYSVALLPGVSTTGGPRGASINGLPNNTVNITIDGVGTGNMLQSGDGFFSMVTPRMDAVEEVTVTGAVPGAGGGAGSVQVAFVTRSGSNQFAGSFYSYIRHPKFNTNYYFNTVNGLGNNQVKVYTSGTTVGGPIVLPGFDGRGKAFFFFNMEWFHQPNQVTRTRTILRPTAETGLYGYSVTTAGVASIRTVNLPALAAANSLPFAIDPTVASVLAKIRAATATAGTINDTGAGSTLQYVFQPTAIGNQYAPVARLDYSLSNKHRLTGVYYWQRFKSNPDLLNGVEAAFPGGLNFGSQNSYRTQGSMTLRSTLSSNMVNELKGGLQWSPNDFFANVTKDQFSDQDGYALSFPLVTSPSVVVTPQPRNTTTWSLENSLSWLRGAHSIKIGGSYAGLLNRQNAYTVTQNIVLGFNATFDPAAGIFNTTNFPGASTGNLNDARALYALLTGRVSSIPGTARLDSATGKYVYNGDLAQKTSQNTFALYVEDSWRATPTLTINTGLRWDMQRPFTTVTNTFSRALMADLCGISGVGAGPGGRTCNMFKGHLAGNQTGKAVPQYTAYKPGTPSHKMNWFQFAPSVGVAWRPNVQDGLLRTFLGSPEQATLRAGYAVSYNQERIDRFTIIGGNPGGTLNVQRDATTGYPIVPTGQSWPVLFSERARLAPPVFPEAPVYPISATTANNINIFPNELKTPIVHSYSVGFQRSIGDDMAIEIRYVGNRNLHTWGTENWNERNIIENGFIDEFKLAQANLKANIALGRGNTFAYTGTGTSPLPIHLAYLTGRGAALAATATSYTGANWSNAAFLARFSYLEPEVAAAAGAIDTTAFRPNGIAAGLTPNFFVMNPAVGNATIQQDRNSTRYNSLQIEMRRRLSKGLLVSANYTYGIRKGVTNQSLHFDRFRVDTTDVPHVLKTNFTYEIPVGRGRRFGTDMNRVLNAIVGNWEISGNARFQRQRYQLDGVRLVGITKEDLQRVFKIRIVQTPGVTTTVFSMPQDIIDNTRKAYSTDPTTATGYSAGLGVPTGRYLAPPSSASCIYLYRGDCNTPDIDLNGPLFTRVDLRLKKQFPFLRKGSIEVDAEVLNAFNNINFNHSLSPGESTNAFRVTSAYTDVNTTQDPGGRLGQLVFRINW